MCPPERRSLDAIHLASARTPRRKLKALVCYDVRLAEPAAWCGAPVASPSWGAGRRRSRGLRAGFRDGPVGAGVEDPSAVAA